MRLHLEARRPDFDLIALWLFSFMGHSEDLLLRYLEEWPNDYRPFAKA